MHLADIARNGGLRDHHAVRAQRLGQLLLGLNALRFHDLADQRLAFCFHSNLLRFAYHKLHCESLSFSREK